MKRAIEQAMQSDVDIPVGAVIIKDGKVIASAFNTKEKENDVTCHAEISAVRQAEKALNNWRLDGCEMYVTLEPCPMCAWALICARLDAVYFGSFDKMYGALGSVIDLRKFANSKMKVYGGIMEEECDNILKKYFLKMRENNG